MKKFNRFTLGIVASAPFALLLSSPVYADSVRPGDEKLPEPSFQEEQEAPMVMPAVPQPAEKPVPGKPVMTLREITFSGNTVFSDEELLEIAKPWMNRPISNSELQQMRHMLSMAYVDKGYVNSGVIIPDQKISEGSLQLQVVEGELVGIVVTNEGRLKDDYISDRLSLGDAPLNVNTLQEKLLLLQQNPLVEQVKARLAPSMVKGQAILKTDIVEARPYDVYLTLDNQRSPSIGGERIRLEAMHRNVTGRGDMLSGNFGAADGADDFGISYSIPVNANDTTISFRYDQSESVLVEEPFDLIDLESTSQTYAIGLMHPVYRKLNESFSLGLSLEQRRSKSRLLGHPFSFSPAADNGELKISVLRFSQDWTRRSQNEVISARSTFSLGFDAWDASIDSNNADGKFMSWLGQAQWARRFGENRNQVILRGDIQLAEDELLPMEKFAVGGANSVRGYRENQLVRDNGIIASAEVRIPLFRDENGMSNLQVAPFVDAGYSWDKGQREDAVDIASVGVGLLWQPHRQVNAELYLAHGFTEFDNTEYDLQDSGIHFSLRYSFF